MTENELAGWLAVTESSRFKWVEDEIVRLNGRGAMYYTGGEDGIYMRIGNEGKLEAGSYEGAFPHIGEAMFTPKAVRQFDNFNDAFAAMMNAGGKKFLMDMFSQNDPQQFIVRREPAEKPSVLNQIREAKKAPPAPHKGNPAHDKHKGGPEL